MAEYRADNSRLVPNISLIIYRSSNISYNYMFLTDENNNTTFFEDLDPLESFDDIINRFPSPTETIMPGLKIYGDNTDKSKAKNIKLFNDAQQWRSSYLFYHELDDTDQSIRLNVDALMIDNIIMDKYDGNYRYYMEIDNSGYIYLYLTIHNTILNVLCIKNDGLFYYYDSIIFPSPTETRMPCLNVSSYYISNNIKLYNDAIQWRKDYISYNGLSDTGQPISMFVDILYIDQEFMDQYDNSYNYHIDIYNDRIILLNDRDSSEVLIISSDGSVTILDIFNKFPFPIKIGGDDGEIDIRPDKINMLGLKIYTDNTDQSKSNNIEIYNDAQKYRKDYIFNNDLSDTGQPIRLNVDAVMIDNIIIDEYDYNGYHYHIDIYKDHITLLNDQNSSEVLTIFSDGSVEDYITPTPTTAM